MITHIRMKNFKSWKDSGKVKLAPLTGFFGTNSSGKSSLLQMLLLLKQTVENVDIERPIPLGNRNSFMEFLDFSEVINTLEAPVEFGVGGKLDEPRPIYTSLQNEPPPILMMESFTFDTTLRESMKRPIVENFRYRINPNGILEIVWERQELAFGNQIDGNSFETTSLKSIRNCYGAPLSTKGKPHHFLLQFTSAFEELFSDIYYLDTIQGLPDQFFYQINDFSRDARFRNTNKIVALVTELLRQQVRLPQEDRLSFEKQISKWLQRMGLAYAFAIEQRDYQSRRSYEIFIQKQPMDTKKIHINTGSGLALLLPVLILCYGVPEGSTLILEHPDNLLHPMAQADLADLLIEVITERKLQILVESHSEYLLTRLQRRIAEEKISSDQTALYFCENDNGSSKLITLDLDELGNIKNWPKNFFGNEMGDLFAMTKAQSERRKRMEVE